MSGILILDDGDPSIVYTGQWGKAGNPSVEYNGTTTWTDGGSVNTFATMNFTGRVTVAPFSPQTSYVVYMAQARESQSLVPSAGNMLMNHCCACSPLILWKGSGPPLSHYLPPRNLPWLTTTTHSFNPTLSRQQANIRL